MDKNCFSSLKLNSWITKRLDTVGIKVPTPIQKNCIVPILDGKDCIGAAKTGSGKTLAFALPILQKLSEEPYGIFALVLTPTRELAYQIRDSFAAIGAAINLSTAVIVGGMEMVDQGHQLTRQPHVVIATPGRLKDHIESCDTFSLKRIKFLVIDEADRLLGGGYDVQMETIFKVLPKKKQTLCFSATINDTMDCLRKITEGNVFVWTESYDVATVDDLKQYYLLCPNYAKDGYLIQLIRAFQEEHTLCSVIIFTDTCRNCQILSMLLNELQLNCVSLHGLMSQRRRLHSLSQFKMSKIRILVATDVASRGLDIPEVELIINHNVPSAPKDYIHRVGRTARAGRGGIAVSLVTPTVIALVHAIEAEINAKLKEYTVDSSQVATLFTQVSVTRRKAEIELDMKDFGEKKDLYKRKNLILEGKNPDDPGLGSTKFEVIHYKKNKSKNRLKKFRPSLDQ